MPVRWLLLLLGWRTELGLVDEGVVSRLPGLWTRAQNGSGRGSSVIGMILKRDEIVLIVLVVARVGSEQVQDGNLIDQRWSGLVESRPEVGLEAVDAEAGAVAPINEFRRDGGRSRDRDRDRDTDAVKDGRAGRE